ncbi:hypothetical protein, partial [Nocardia sp. MH4]|uniref:hypothetical protein n=1 Tax=Nocardia sp. MH4 TaxID=1768677 RepID=UPI001C4E65D0
GGVSVPAAPGRPHALDGVIAVADEHLLAARQQTLVLAVVEALNAGGADDLHGRVRAAVKPRPEPTDIDAVHRIVSLEWVGYTPGEKPAVILARILDRLEELAS